LRAFFAFSTCFFAFLTKAAVEFEAAELAWDVELSEDVELAREVEFAAKEVELSAGDVELAAREVELSAREVELAVREVELSAREVELAAREVELSAREVELAVREVELSAREVELAVREVELSAREVELSAREVELSAREVELAKEAEVEFAAAAFWSTFLPPFLLPVVVAFLGFAAVLAGAPESSSLVAALPFLLPFAAFFLPAALLVPLFATTELFPSCTASCESALLICWSPVETFCWLALHWLTLRLL